MMRQVRWAVPVVAVATMLVGCGGEAPTAAPSGTAPAAAVSPPATTSAAPATSSTAAAAVDGGGEGALTAAVRSYSSAFLSGKGEAAYALLSARCRARVTAAEFASIAEQARSTYGDLPITSLTVDALAGGMARVTYSYAVPALKQTGEPWVLEGGAWRQDDC